MTPSLSSFFIILSSNHDLFFCVTEVGEKEASPRRFSGQVLAVEGIRGLKLDFMSSGESDDNEDEELIIM